MKRTRGNPGLKGRLLDNSTDAYVLALETINRLSIKYRVETFAYLICNAWELMLKAKIIHDSSDKKSIYYKKKRDEPRRSLSLRDCLKRVFPDDFDPTRRNIELVADLRDEPPTSLLARYLTMCWPSCKPACSTTIRGWGNGGTSRSRSVSPSE